LAFFYFAIALGLRTIVNNPFAEIMLLILEPYKLGGYIEGGRIDGIVWSLN